MIDKKLIKQRDREISHLQMIEGNPFDAEDDAMFAEFDRQGLTLDEQRAAIKAKALVSKSSSWIGAAPHNPAAE